MTEPRFIRNGGEDSIKNDRSNSTVCIKDGNGTRLNHSSLPFRRQ